MKVIAFLILAWVMLGMEVGIRDDLRIGPLPVATSFFASGERMSARTKRAPFGTFCS